MCTHEIWTYRECGCRIDHHVSCTESPTYQDGQHRGRETPKRLEKASSFRSQTNSSPIKLPPSPSPTDSEDEAHLQSWRRRSGRACSIHRTIHKTFLEPICDDCLLAEMGAQSIHNSTNGVSYSGHARNGSDRLIWDSDVKIEVNEQEPAPSSQPANNSNQYVEERKILGSNVEVQVSDISRPKSGFFPMFSQRPAAAATTSTLSVGDADSESSAPSVPFRGRARSRTKQLRRMAMDVSREDLRLRVSSRWSSAQRQGMQLFKDELQKGHQKKCSTTSEVAESPSRVTNQPQKTFMQRLTDAQGVRWTKAKGAVHALSRKMSRKSQSPRRATRSRSTLPFGHSGLNNNRSLDAVCDKEDYFPQTVGTRQPDENMNGDLAPGRVYFNHNDPSNPAIGPSLSSSAPTASIPDMIPQETWQSHLQHDLDTPRSRQRHPIVDLKAIDTSAALLKETAKPLLDMPLRTGPSGSTSTTAVSARTSSFNWQSHPSAGSNPFSHKSYEYSTTKSDDSEAGRRLLTSSTAPSIPATASSASFSIPSHCDTGQRLASIVTSDEFDDLDDHSARVGTEDIEREMAMVGLTANPWRGPSMNTDEAYEAVIARNNESRLPSVTGEPPRTASEEPDPFTDQTPTRPPHASTVTGGSPPTAIRAPRTNTSTQDSNILPTTSFAARAAATPSPNLSLATISDATHTQIALHALSTPFHASLAPQHHFQSSPSYSPSHRPYHPPQHQIQRPNIASILHDISPPRPQSAPHPQSSAHPYATIAHVDPRTTPPEAPAGFALGASSPSPTGLFSCIWVREICPGKCGGKITAWRVRSCLCGGNVRVASAIGDGEPGVNVDVEMHEGNGSVVALEAQCRSGAPVVRYVQGRVMCGECAVKREAVAENED